jgi:exopolysaccharide transport family protein
MALDLRSNPQIGYQSRGYAPAPPPPTDENIDWFGLVRTLWRRKFFLIGFVGICLALTSAYVSTLEPGYEAEAQVMLNDRPTQVTDIQEVIEAQPFNENTMQGQVVLIQSRFMAERLADRLQLQMLPEFNPALGPDDGGVAALFNPANFIPDVLLNRLPRAWADTLIVTKDDPGLTDDRQAALLRTVIIKNVQDRISAVPANDSTVVSLNFVSSDPELAKLGANMLAELYLSEQLESKQSETRFGREFLEEEVARLRASVAAAEQAIQNYRQQTGLAANTGDQPTVDVQQLTGLTTQLVLSRGERAAAEARAKQVEQLLNSNSNLEAAAQLLESPTLTALRTREVELAQEIADLANEYGERHPLMVNLRSEQAQLDVRTKNEIRNIAQRLRDEVNVLRSREASLEANIDVIKQQLSQSSNAEIELQALERDAEADRELLLTYNNRLREVASQEKAQRPDARIIAPAILPIEPSYPRRPLIFGVAIFASLLMGSLAVFGLEMMDNTFRSSEQVDQVLGLPTLGMVPAIRGMEKRYGAPEDYVLDHPNSPFGEALRSLRTAMLLSGVERAPRTVLFTSSVPSEGKSSTAMCIARVHARSGRRTMIIDCDVRRARLHELARIENHYGLMDVLAHDRDLDEVTHIDDRSGAAFVTAGGVVPDPAALLASDRMRQLLQRASEDYDLVILDSPPVLSVSDARVLAQIADKTVFLVHWGSTRRSDVMMAVKQLVDAGADMAGLVLSRVNVKKHAGYGYSDSGLYHDDKYTKYYNTTSR